MWSYDAFLNQCKFELSSAFYKNYIPYLMAIIFPKLSNSEIYFFITLYFMWYYNFDLYLSKYTHLSIYPIENIPCNKKPSLITL